MQAEKHVSIRNPQNAEYLRNTQGPDENAGVQSPIPKDTASLGPDWALGSLPC